MLVTVALNEQDLRTIIMCCLQGSASAFLEQRMVESPSIFSVALPGERERKKRRKKNGVKLYCLQGCTCYNRGVAVVYGYIYRYHN
jgi:hypothetical protein